MSNLFFERPILNSPYDCPPRHWELDADGQPTQRIIETRRRAEFITPIPKPKKRKSTAQQEMVFDEGQGLSTKEQTKEQPYDPTSIIWLTEVAPHSKAGKRLLEHLASANKDANPELMRLALKLATGAGKTTVIAMLIAWQTINAVRRSGSKNFTRGILVVAPGLTIKDRLRVLQPNDPDSYYASRELVPGDILDDINHGTEYRRPFASQQIFTGDLFEQADHARDFVLAKINRSVGIRDTTMTAPATYELPPEAVAEAIVNAIAHRDYHSHASVEVRLLADRLEVWNPGTLPDSLTLDDLRVDHPSIPANPLIADSLYLARYIEKAGSGTQRVIELCHQAGLPEPDFEVRQGSFVLTLWRDWLTDEVLAGLNLNDRQRRVIPAIRRQQRFTNSDYQSLTGASRATAKRDLEELIAKGVILSRGKGRGAHYEFKSKRLINGSNGS